MPLSADLEDLLRRLIEKAAEQATHSAVPVRRSWIRRTAEDVVTKTMMAAGGAIVGLACSLALGRRLDDIGHLPPEKKMAAVLAFFEELSEVLDRREARHQPRSTGCEDCDAWGFGYMVQHEIWDVVTEDSPVDFLCIPCLEKRLGRSLSEADFLDVPINGPVFAAFRISREHGSHQTH